MKKKSVILSLLISTLVILSGCEKKDNGPTATGQSGPIVMQIWTTEQSTFLQALTREFLSALDNSGLKMNVIEFSSEKELNKFLLNKMSEGDGPDIIYTNGNWIAQNKEKLSPRVQDEGLNITNFKNTFVRSAQETLTGNGEIYGVPLGVETLALIYNEEHLLDRLPDKNMPSKTWKEFKEDSIALTKPDNSFQRFAFSGGALGRFDNIKYGFDIMENMMLQAGVKFFTEDGSLATFHTSVGATEDGKKENLGITVVDFFTSFADPRFKNYSWSEFLAHPESEQKNFEAFANGKVSMIFGYSHDLKSIKNLIKEDTGLFNKKISEKNIQVTYLPQFEDPNLSPSRVVIGNVKALAIPKTSKYKETAWRFLKFAIRKENLQNFYKETQIPTPRVDLIPEQENDPQIGIFVRQAKYAKSNILHWPREEVAAEFEKMILAINQGKTNISSALNTVGTNINKFLKSHLERVNEIGQFKK